MSAIRLFRIETCSFCDRAVRLLERRGAGPFLQIIPIDTSRAGLVEMARLTGGKRTVPQIFIGDRHIGGYDDLVELDSDGELEPLIAALAE